MLTKLYVRAENFASSDEGATMVEYGLMVALIAVVVAVAVGPLGTAIAKMFTDIKGSISAG